VQRVRQLWDRLRGNRRESMRSPTRLIIGLGNPGPKYEATRHNIGFRVVERLADRFGGEWRVDRALDAMVARVDIEGEPCLLVQPQTFMNRSGATLRAALECWPELDPETDLLIVYDDMDLEPGRVRLRPRGGGGGHRGIGDILDELDTKRIPRLRFGVGHPGSSRETIDWVLEPFAPEDESTILPDALAKATDAIVMTIRDGITAAMGQFNANS
jgi:PTH1 family peptidyl-tRNA hydrolase